MTTNSSSIGLPLTLRLGSQDMKDEILPELSSHSYPHLLRQNPAYYAHFKKQFHEIIDRKLKKNLSPQKQLEEYKEMYKKRKSILDTTSHIQQH